MRMTRLLSAVPLVALATLPACGDDGVSTAETEAAAKAYVRRNYDVSAETPLSVTVFVGRPRNGETVLCGEVSSAEPAFRPKRFVAALDPLDWLVFEPAHAVSLPGQTDMFAEWISHCSGARGDEGEEPLAPTQIGRDG